MMMMMMMIMMMMMMMMMMRRRRRRRRRRRLSRCRLERIHLAIRLTPTFIRRRCSANVSLICVYIKLWAEYITDVKAND